MMSTDLQSGNFEALTILSSFNTPTEAPEFFPIDVYLKLQYR
jgi:hypothetical protein